MRPVRDFLAVEQPIDSFFVTLCLRMCISDWWVEIVLFCLQGMYELTGQPELLIYLMYTAHPGCHGIKKIVQVYGHIIV